MAPHPRNVHVFNPQTQPSTLLAGINQHGSLCVSSFYSMLHTVLVVQSPWVMYQADAQYQPLNNALDPDEVDLLPLGTYVVLSPDKQPLDVSLAPENYRPRTLSLDMTGNPCRRSNLSGIVYARGMVVAVLQGRSSRLDDFTHSEPAISFQSRIKTFGTYYSYHSTFKMMPPNVNKAPIRSTLSKMACSSVRISTTLSTHTTLP